MLSRFSEWFQGIGCVRAVGLALCVALLAASAGAQSSDGWRIDTIAGSGEPGHGGDGGPAGEARLFFPWGVAADHAGNVYIADSGNHRVRRIDTTGTVATFAGTGQPGYDQDVGLAVETPLTSPTGVAVDGSGNLYFTGPFNFLILRVDATGTMSEVEGTRESYDGPDDERRLSRDRGIAADDAGNVYIANIDNNYIRRVDATGTVSVIAGTPRKPGYGGDGGPAVEAQLASPFALAVDSSGKLYVADLGNYRIRVLTQSMDSGGARAPLL